MGRGTHYIRIGRDVSFSESLERGGGGGEGGGEKQGRGKGDVLL